MAQAAIAAEIHQPLDVHGDLAPEVALDDIVAVDGLADLQHLGIGQLVHAALGREMPTLLADVLANFGPMPWIYWSAMTTRFCVGIFTPAMRATSSPRYGAGPAEASPHPS